MAAELLPYQLEQAERMILSVSSTEVLSYLNGFDSLPDNYIGSCYGFKAPGGTDLAFGDHNSKKKHMSLFDFGILAAERGAKRLIVDTRFGNEGHDLITDIDNWLDGATPEAVMQPFEQREKARLSSRFYDDHEYGADEEYERVKRVLTDEAQTAGIFPPSALTVNISGNTDEDELRVAVEHAGIRGVNLIAIIGTSKKSKIAFEKHDIDPIRYSATLGAIALGGGITWVQTAAVDAEKLRTELAKTETVTELKIVGTGAYAEGHPRSDHDRPIQIEHTSGVDMYIQGASVLTARIPTDAYVDHVTAMPRS